MDKIKYKRKQENYENKIQDSGYISERQEDRSVGSTIWLDMGYILKWVLEFGVLSMAKVKVIEYQNNNVVIDYKVKNK